MSKRVRLAIPGVRVNETSWRVLYAIAERALAFTGLRCGPVVMSYRQMRSFVPVSKQTIMRSCMALQDGGMLVVRGNRLEHGGRNANTYEVTALGLEVLRQAEELRRAERGWWRYFVAVDTGGFFQSASGFSSLRALSGRAGFGVRPGNLHGA